MKRLCYPTILLLLFFCLTGHAQTDIQRDTRVNHILKQIAAKRPGLKMFNRKDGLSAYVNMAVLDDSKQQLKWFTCYGAAFDSVSLSSSEYDQVATGTMSPFTFYRNYYYGTLSYIEYAGVLFRTKGNVALQDTSQNIQVIFTAPLVRSAKSPLQKLMAIEGLMKRISLRLQLFDSRSPSLLKQTQNDSRYIRETLAGIMISKSDSTEYYNSDPLATASRIVLRRRLPGKLFVYGQQGVLLDSVPLKPGKYTSLLKEKEDVFLLYRGWLELQWQQVADRRSQYLSRLHGLDSGLYNHTSNESIQEIREMVTGLREQQRMIADKIRNLVVPEEKNVAQLLAAASQHETSEISYLPGLGFAYSLSYVRGQKAYELGDHRGNIMAIVSDREKGVNDDANATVDYYYADVINANDYFPFGSLMPGRTFSTENSYRYGFNAKENDNEVMGEGNFQDYGMRIYDPRIARFLSIDPLTKEYPWYTPYQFAGNKPIQFVDIDGQEEGWPKILDDARKVINTATEIYSYAKATTRVINNLVNFYNHPPLEPYIHLEGKYKIGARAAFEVKKLAGFDIDLGSVELFSVSADYNFKTKQWDATYNFLGKDGVVVGSQNLSASLPVGALFGAPVGAGLSFSDGINIDTRNKQISHTEAYDFGASIGPVSVNTSAEQTTNTSNGQTTKTVKGYVASSAAQGIIMSGEYKIDAGLRLSHTTQSDPDDDEN